MKYALILGLLLLALTLFAAPVTREQAETAALNWAAMWAPQGFDAKTVESVIPKGDKSGTDLYLFQFRNGFVVTSADDAVKPILAYGFDTVVGNPDDNPSFRDHLYNLQQEINEIKTNRIDNSQTFSEWQSLLNNTLPRDNTRSISPLISTKWDQGWPYNMYCPEDPSGPNGHVYAGCVATAMAQVTKYWNWPPTGEGSHTYYAWNYGSQSANFGATTYDWNSMPNQVHEPNAEVATLLYHLGVSVDMMYSPDGSGAYSQDVPDALIDHFRYDSSAQYKQKSNYSSSAWEQMLRDELDSARPLYYSGSGPGGGHAFNCDGYQGTNYFHFNWGWSGSYDGYFYVSNLNPGYTFNSYQGAVFNIMPINYSMSTTQMSLQGMDCSVGDVTTVSVVSYPLMPDWNVNSMSFTVEYDDTNMTYLNYETTGTMLEGANITSTLLQPGRMSFTVSSSSNLMGAGTLLKLKFQPLIPGMFAFNLADFNLNGNAVSQLNATMINVTAEISEVQNTVIDLLNAMYVPYNEIAVIPITTTFILPTWNVTTANFVLTFPADLLQWEGYDTDNCLTANADIDITELSCGVLSFNIDFNGLLVGSGNFLKLNFRTIGNTSSVGLAAITANNFLFNQTQIQNPQPGYVVLLPVVSSDDNVAVTADNLSIGPNPFSTKTDLALQFSKANQNAEISIYNLKGQLVRLLYRSEVKGNSLNLSWDGKNDQNRQVTAGMYLLRIKSDSFNKSYKLTLLK